MTALLNFMWDEPKWLRMSLIMRCFPETWSKKFSFLWGADEWR